MHLYLRVLFSKLKTYLLRTTIIAAVLFVVFGLFIQWSFPKHTSSISATQIAMNQEKKLLDIFARSEYQSESGKKVAAIEKLIFCKLIGSFCSTNPNEQDKYFRQSIFGSVSNLLITPLMNPPASGLAYIQHSFQEAGFVPKSYAAEGIGFASLHPFLEVWKAFRNIAYLMLVLIIIALGFMIMFQYKLDSHTVLSVQGALPKIVIALLYITFSYAIAGLLIDFTYILILLIFQIFSMTNIPEMNATVLQNKYLTSNILTIADGGGFSSFTGYLYFKALTNIFFVLPFWIKIALSYIIIETAAFTALRFSMNSVPIWTSIFGHFELTTGVGAGIKAGDIVGVIAALIFGTLYGGLAVTLFLLGVVIAGLLVLYARIVFMLLSSYIQLIVNIIFAPILLLMGAIPGQESFSGWVRKIIGNLIVFPIVIALILVIQVIQTIGFNGSQDAFSLPLLYGFETDVLAMLISGAFLFMIPDIAKQVSKKIAGESSIKAGAGALFGGVGVLAGSAMGIATQVSTLNKAVGGQGKVPGFDKFSSWVLGKFKKKEDH